MTDILLHSLIASDHEKGDNTEPKRTVIWQQWDVEAYIFWVIYYLYYSYHESLSHFNSWIWLDLIFGRIFRWAYNSVCLCEYLWLLERTKIERETYIIVE